MDSPSIKHNQSEWQQAVDIIFNLTERAAREQEQKACYHDGQSEGDNYSHTEAAKYCRQAANNYRHAFQVVTRGY
ncbi:MAG: hypothetical protein CMQ88_04195 [Gammaproteobacteria bacterium]|nr:hypothetical protein [Gammaproteobacteria bacterium]